MNGKEKVLFYLIGGVWVATELKSNNPERNNHLIISDYGDWSGFRKLAACLAQIPNYKNRRDGFYRIVER